MSSGIVAATSSSSSLPITLKPYTSVPLRFVTAASLFDGHDATINIIRRILQAAGAEVIHLGHNRSVEEIVNAAIQEDANGIAVSSYQGGHVEFFKYMIDLLQERNASHIQVFGGGGGVITPAEISELETYGVCKIYSPEEGQRLGLKGMIADMLEKTPHDTCQFSKIYLDQLHSISILAKFLTALEQQRVPQDTLQILREKAQQYQNIPVLGITGTGGAGKSSLIDEILQRFKLDKKDIKIAVLALDPTKRKSGGALLGDRIRMNSLLDSQIFFRSFATRTSEKETIPTLPDLIAACKLAGYECIFVETPGIGQGDAAITHFVSASLYVMTPEYGAASQLEKIEMLDYADIVAINKFDRKGALDALREVRKQFQRNKELFSENLEDLPIFGTMASHFNDEGTTVLYHEILNIFKLKNKNSLNSNVPKPSTKFSKIENQIIPPERVRYLAEVSDTVRQYKQKVRQYADIARKAQHLTSAATILANEHTSPENSEQLKALGQHYFSLLPLEQQKLLQDWPAQKARYAAEEYVFSVRGQELKTSLFQKSLAGIAIPKVALPEYQDQGDLLQWQMLENVPGEFPFTAGVFPFKRQNEAPGRMFAGEGDAYRTNKRFKLLSEHSDAKRLSTAFDSVTLYGWDPDLRPDIYGKIGNAGVSIATIEDMQILYEGFDLVHPSTSVSMTINGPAPSILAMFLNTAIRQVISRFEKENLRMPTPEEEQKLIDFALENVRGTVQADILKEDQGQNTCIFSTEFSLKMMADMQEYFIQHKVRNFYSVSISGYHIAEAGANPITQLAFTLANAFTYIEAYKARGMKVNDFAHNLSFFFSNGMDPEYAVMGRVARRIWAIVLKEKYGANERSQKLKYHVQTSGRSLHAQEMAFNDIRTTLQALIALYDNCNSLHTNAYDEALTTPTEESVRRALAIQLIINHEWGISKNENPNQGAFIIEKLTDMVEEAVLNEFNRISERGGVLGAMEVGYQRSKIQEESLYYEYQKHDGSLPIIGVNTFVNPTAENIRPQAELARSTEQEKQGQLTRLKNFQEKHANQAPQMLQYIKQTAASGGNIFAALMEAVKVCSLGQITQALCEVGGQYRRNM